MKLLETLMGAKSFTDLFLSKKIDEQFLGTFSLDLDHLVDQARGIKNYDLAIAAQNLRDLIEKYNDAMPYDADEVNVRNQEERGETFEPLSDTSKEPW